MRRFHVRFTEKNLTGNAGLVLLGLFADKLKLAQMIEQHITIERGPTAQYKVSDIIMILIMAVLAGAKHMSHVFILRSDSALRSLFKWERFPDDTTINRVFKLFNPRHCNELSDVEAKVRKKVWGKKWFGRITLDLDSTVRGVYGKQQGAEKGYNPKKPGQRGYHPLLCLYSSSIRQISYLFHERL